MTTTGRTRSTEEFAGLLADAAQRDRRALATVNHLFLPRLTRFAASRGASDPEAVANQALFDGIRSIDRMRNLDERVFRTYLFTSVANRVNNEHRVKQLSTVTLDPEWHGVDVGLDPADLIAPEGWFKDALDELPQSQQAVIVERFSRGSTVRETAERLGRTTDSVRNLQARGLARIQRYVIAAGLLALIVVAVVALAQIGQEQSVNLEPADQQDTPLGDDHQNLAPVEESDESAADSDDDAAADRSTSDTRIAPARTLAPMAWVECAAEADRCAVPGPTEVRYGANGSYAYAYATTSDGLDCNNLVFGDPAPNIPKTCAYAADVSGPVALELLESKTCIDIGGSKLADLDPLVQWSCQPGFSQHQWSLDRQADGSYLIRSAHSGRCMDVGGTGMDADEPVIQTSCDAGVTSQRWSFDPWAVGDYTLRNLQSNLCLSGTVGAQANDASPLVQSRCDTTDVGVRVALIDVGA